MAIGFVVRGRKLIYHNDSSVVVGEGDMFWLDAGVHYEENVVEDELFEQIVFYVSPADLQRIIISLNSNYGLSCDSAHQCDACRRNNFVVCRPSVELHDFFVGVNQSFRRSDLRRNKIGSRIKLSELIYLIVSGEDACLRRKIVAGADVVNGQFAKEIYNNVFNDVSIEILARKTNRSLTSFKKEFRRQFDVPPHKWFIDQRLQRAKVLLMSTNMTISEIGAECAFTNISHFIKLFKQRFDDTPASMRRKSRMEREMVG
jgi:AraC-like DNA-binding protein